ncbi:MAG TPA: HNH endonuclease [Anaerohalosphaeraceae bacterium]|jgi:5-methylcytosine-specific restriction endonuclease McrA|nr:HNH endonuclease [Phycisphaerae bacterium]HOM60722.1 HNH endonuclease [Anaerohalosphaeraceae bacterium]HOT72468.1 HNH endonuclease [Anaerohalosphaeraceae bacterium]HPB92583.1 HNH endonuclease [Anaerohalosphaeraceae bacterium]HQG05975.1 HNH endonuclease [Anaerohalosphaeraceae bacterium]
MISAASQSAMDCRVLVLNKHYMALRVISARRAFSLLCRNLAEVVSCDNGNYANYDFQTWQQISQMKHLFKAQYQDWVSTVNFELAVPRIIRLLFYDRLPRQTVKFNRRNLFARDGNRCQYCGKKFPTSELSLDHVIPRRLGGQSTWENVVCACTQCNVRKGGRTPQQANMKLIQKPLKPKRNPVIHIHLSHERYHSWKQFLDHAYWSVELT